MTTAQEHYQSLRRMGISHEDAAREAQTWANYLRARADEAQRAQAEAANQRPAFDVAQLSQHLQVEQRYWDAFTDPRRAAWHQTEERRLLAEIEALDRQLQPLQQQRAKLVAELAQHQFQG